MASIVIIVMILVNKFIASNLFQVIEACKSIYLIIYIIIVINSIFSFTRVLIEYILNGHSQLLYNIYRKTK